MIVVTVELYPGGYDTNKRVIGIAKIGNVSDLADVSNYTAFVTEDASKLTGLPPQLHKVDIENHRRRQSVWAIVSNVAAEAARKINSNLP